MKTKNFLHYNMALVGGFFGGFTLFFASEMFANAQTVNLLELVGGLFRGDFSEVALRLVGALVYFAALACTVILPRLTRLRLEFVSLAADALALALIALLPPGLNPFFMLYPVFFAMAFQWAVFDEIEGFRSSTIFSSNNYRQFVTSLLLWILDREGEMLSKARVFGFTLLYFHLGAAMAYAGAVFFGRASAFSAFIPLTSALCLLIADKTAERKNIGT